MKNLKNLPYMSCWQDTFIRYDALNDQYVVLGVDSIEESRHMTLEKAREAVTQTPTETSGM